MNSHATKKDFFQQFGRICPLRFFEFPQASCNKFFTCKNVVTRADAQLQFLQRWNINRVVFDIDIRSLSFITTKYEGCRNA